MDFSSLIEFHPILHFHYFYIFNGQLPLNGELKPFLLVMSAPRIALNYGELKTFTPFNGQILQTVKSAPGTNLWLVKPSTSF